MVYHTSHLYPLQSGMADTLSSDNALHVCQCDGINYTTIWAECQIYFGVLVLSKRTVFHPQPKGLTITHKFVGWVEQRPIRKSTQENDFQDSKDLKPSKYK